MSYLRYFLISLLFGAGLEISGMTNPEKVRGFLDIFGNWDPSLAFVMMGAIGINFFFTKFASKKEKPVFESQFHWPTKKEITMPLVTGSALFGIGWALGGFCPGPAIVSLYRGQESVFIFVAAMTIGMLAYSLYENFTTQ